MKKYTLPDPPPKHLVCPESDGTTCQLCGCGNQPPKHCMFCLRDLSEETIAELSAYKENCGPQPFVETRQDEYYLIWDGEHGPFATASEAFLTIGVSVPDGR